MISSKMGTLSPRSLQRSLISNWLSNPEGINSESFSQTYALKLNSQSYNLCRIYLYSSSRLVRDTVSTQTILAAYDRHVFLICFWMKSRFVSKYDAFSPLTNRSTFPHTTIIGIPRLSSKTPYGKSIIAFISERSSTSSSTSTSGLFGSALEAD